MRIYSDDIYKCFHSLAICDAQHFHWQFIAVSTQSRTVHLLVYITGKPTPIANMQSMGNCDSFGAIAADENTPRFYFILMIVYQSTINVTPTLPYKWKLICLKETED